MNDLILRVFYDNAWNDLDIDSNIPLRLNVSTVENTDIGQIFGVGSQAFNLPGTRNNNLFFEGAFKVGAEDVPAIYNSINAQVMYNGESVLQGEMQLIEVITDEDGFVEYKVIVEDSVVQLKDALDGALIKDADWSAYTHTLNQTNLLDSWEGTLVNGDIFYPVADYGMDNKDDYPTLPRLQVDGTAATGVGAIDNSSYPLRLQQVLPSISARAVVGAIFEQAGFRCTSSLIDDTGTGNEATYSCTSCFPVVTLVLASVNLVATYSATLVITLSIVSIYTCRPVTKKSFTSSGKPVNLSTSHCPAPNKPL